MTPEMRLAALAAIAVLCVYIIQRLQKQKAEYRKSVEDYAERYHQWKLDVAKWEQQQKQRQQGGGR